MNILQVAVSSSIPIFSLFSRQIVFERHFSLHLPLRSLSEAKQVVRPSISSTKQSRLPYLHPPLVSNPSNPRYSTSGGSRHPNPKQTLSISLLTNVFEIELPELTWSFRAFLPQSVHAKKAETWQTQVAPEPRDVIWANLGIPWWEKFVRQSAVYGITFLIVFFFMIPITIVSGFSTLDNLKKFAPFLRSVFNM